jgi:hypothetical protein
MGPSHLLLDPSQVLSGPKFHLSTVLEVGLEQMMAVQEVVCSHIQAPCLAAIMIPTLFEGLELVLETLHLVFSDFLKLQVFVLGSYYPPNFVTGRFLNFFCAFRSGV